MRDANSRKDSSSRNRRRPGGRNSGSSAAARRRLPTGRGHGISGHSAQQPDVNAKGQPQGDFPQNDASVSDVAIPHRENRDSRPSISSGDAASGNSAREAGYFYYDNRNESRTARSSATDSSHANREAGYRPRTADGALASNDPRYARASAKAYKEGVYGDTEVMPVVNSSRAGRNSSHTEERSNFSPKKWRKPDKRRVRKFALASLGAHGVALLFVISLALIGITVFGGGLTELPATIASLWLVFNAGPFGFNGTDLGLVPAVPAMLLMAFLAWRVRREVADRISIRDVRALVGTFLGVPLVLTTVAWLMLLDAHSVLQRVKVPDFWHALLAAFLVNLIALIIGMGERLLRALLRRRGLPEWLLVAARLAASYVAWLWIVGAFVTLISVIWHHQTLNDTFTISSGAADSVLMVLLSLLYLPNFAIAALGILVGAPVNFGSAEISLFAVTSTTMPPLPIMAALPQSLVSPVFGVLLVLPAFVAAWRVLIFLRKRIGGQGGMLWAKPIKHEHSSPAEGSEQTLNDNSSRATKTSVGTVQRGSERPYLVVVVAAVWSGFFVAVLSWLQGGKVGVYGWSGANWWMSGLLASMWLAVVGAVVVVGVTGLPKREVHKAPAPVAAESLPDSSAVSGAGEVGATSDDQTPANVAEVEVETGPSDVETLIGETDLAGHDEESETGESEAEELEAEKSANGKPEAEKSADDESEVESQSTHGNDSPDGEQ